MNYFDILGVPSGATDDEVARAYRARARQLHPDAHPDATAAERAHYQSAMTRLNVAYQALRSDERRVAGIRAEASRDAPNRSYWVPTNTKRHATHGGLWLVVLWLAAFSTALVMLGSLTAGTGRSDPWHVGACVVGQEEPVTPVPCSVPHDGRITRLTLDGFECPLGGSDDWVRRGSLTFCIDTDR
jgi:DnaJ domain